MKQFVVPPFEDVKTKFVIPQGIYCFEYNGRCALLNPHNGSFFLANEKLISQLSGKSLPEDLQYRLVARGIAHIEDGRNKVGFCSAMAPRPTFFIIDLTTKCNLSCKYCFRCSSDRSRMPQKVLLKICDFISGYCREQNIFRPTIQFWGGEPLLEFGHICIVVEYFARTEVHPKYVIETNGTLLDESNVKSLLKMNVDVGVSIDGDRIAHDSQRVFPSNKGSYDSVVRGIKILKENGFANFGSITVVTKQSLGRIGIILRHLVGEIGLKHVKLNFMRYTGSDGAGMSTSEIRDFAKELCHEVYSLTIEGSDFSEGNLLERLKNLLHPRCNNICKSCGCRGGIRMISFDKNGSLFPCELTDFPDEEMGSIYSGKSITEILNDAIQKRPFFSDHNFELCRSCPWHYYCRGGCRAAMKRDSNYAKIDEAECAYNKIVYPFLMELILKKDSAISAMSKGMYKFR